MKLGSDSATTDPSGVPPIKVENLKMYFPVKAGVFSTKVGEVKAVDDVSFEIRKGETLGLVGESGCGKSTLGRTLLRLYSPTAGNIYLSGQQISHLNMSSMRPLRKKIQMIFQDPFDSLNSRHTVGMILEEPLLIFEKMSRSERNKRVLELLDKVGLPRSAINRYPHEFSGGQRQRIGIARAVCLKPEVVICDEPVSALDVSIQSQVMNLLMDLQRDLSLSFLFIAHDLSVVRHISDRVAVMYLGQIVEIAHSTELQKGARHPYTAALLSAAPEPDPLYEVNRFILEGEVPSPMYPPSGCKFHPRCPFAQELCRKEVPVLKDLESEGQDQHQVACHLVEEIKIDTFRKKRS